jgi:arsenate reductase
MTAHWGFEDPVAVDGPEDVRVRAFQKVLYQISNRIAIFLSLPMEKLDKIALQQQVREIGSLPPSDDPSTIGQAL